MANVLCLEDDERLELEPYGGPAPRFDTSYEVFSQSLYSLEQRQVFQGEF